MSSCCALLHSAWWLLAPCERRASRDVWSWPPACTCKCVVRRLGKHQGLAAAMHVWAQAHTEGPVGRPSMMVMPESRQCAASMWSAFMWQSVRMGCAAPSARGDVIRCQHQEMRSGGDNPCTLQVHKPCAQIVTSADSTVMPGSLNACHGPDLASSDGTPPMIQHPALHARGCMHCHQRQPLSPQRRPASPSALYPEPKGPPLTGHAMQGPTASQAPCPTCSAPQPGWRACWPTATASSAGFLPAWDLRQPW